MQERMLAKISAGHTSSGPEASKSYLPLLTMRVATATAAPPPACGPSRTVVQNGTNVYYRGRAILNAVIADAGAAQRQVCEGDRHGC